jgi:hypothetical protein
VVAEALTELGSAIIAFMLNRVVSQVRNADEPWLKEVCAEERGSARTAAWTY